MESSFGEVAESWANINVENSFVLLMVQNSFVLSMWVHGAFLVNI
jgi:hypothetical protein